MGARPAIEFCQVWVGKPARLTGALQLRRPAALPSDAQVCGARPNSRRWLPGTGGAEVRCRSSLRSRPANLPPGTPKSAPQPAWRAFGAAVGIRQELANAPGRQRIIKNRPIAESHQADEFLINEQISTPWSWHRQDYGTSMELLLRTQGNPRRLQVVAASLEQFHGCWIKFGAGLLTHYLQRLGRCLTPLRAPFHCPTPITFDSPVRNAELRDSFPKQRFAFQRGSVGKDQN